MKTWRKNPVIYEINTRVWLEELSHNKAGKITLANVPAEIWDSIYALKADAVWFMGVWERSPAGIQISNNHAGNLADFYRALPDFNPADNAGSPYCVRNYYVDNALGGDEGLFMARQQLAQRGIQLILDFVPNHLAHDHPWAEDHPDFFIRGSEADLQVDSVTFTRSGEHIFACGKDPYYPAWQDVLQVNAFNPEFRKANQEVVNRIASQCDGIRCDMAMLLMNDVFEKTWGYRAGKRPVEEYWQSLIEKVKGMFPDFLFMAEVYWDLEWALQQQGFDYCYDKRLYDRLEQDDVYAIREHLQADTGFQSKLVRFIENHDEPRSASVFPKEKRNAAALVMASLPGAKLIYEGQIEGRLTKLPVFLSRRPDEPRDEATEIFYKKLLEIISSSAFHEGQWQLCECGGWADNDNYKYFLAWTWKLEDQYYLVVINYRGQESQGKIRLCWPELKDGNWILFDLFSGASYERSGNEMIQPGLYIGLPAWGIHLFKLCKNLS